MARFGDELVAAKELAERWAIHDPDPVTRGKIDALVDAGDPSLIRLFQGRLGFGTAGLRAKVGPGPQQMNALVVRQTTAAVVDWLRKNGVDSPRVVIGFDARRDSAAFAAHAAAAVNGSGGRALCSDQAAPTPVYAHAVLAESADAAVVITASHNPPDDNGYKLYLSDGLQLVSPADAEIAQLIGELAGSWSERGSQIDDAFAELDGADLGATSHWLAEHRDTAVATLFTDDRTVRIAYSAMHGVGGAPVVAAFAAAGFDPPDLVLEQFEPDGDFPTVPFPNPEEPGAFDMAVALAEEIKADAAFANDPDADRLAVAVPSRSGAGFVALSGNELGVLLADHVLAHTSGDDRLVARSIVSSRQLDAMAAGLGITCHVSLTGFKWVARPIVSHPEHRFVFGYEEAIGYCIGKHVRDKDGVSAALVAAEMFAGFGARRSNAWQRLDELAAEHGVFANHPMSVRFDQEPARIHALMEQVEASPPTTLAGSPVVAAGAVGLGALPKTSGLHLICEDDTQVIVRPSGTEPKIKAYIEVLESVPGKQLANVAAARSAAAERLAEVVADVQALLA